MGLLFVSAISSFAIEGLQISVQSSNVVLSWPSLNDGSETYIVQYRPTLDTNSSWLTLADYFPAAVDTNITFFIHSNAVNYAGGGANRDTSSPEIEMMNGSEAASGSTAARVIKPATPLAMPANGSGDAVPLSIYPPGLDLSGLIIFDPATGEWVSGKGYSVRSFSGNGAQAGGAQPMDDSSGGTNYYTGFYRVVRDGAHLFGITNDMILSGIVTIPVELANSSGDVLTISLTEDGSPVGNSIQTAPLTSPLALKVDTTLMSNGSHQISASARWEDTNGGSWEADSPVISVTVSNEISFPNWMPSFGELDNSLLIRATSAHTNVNWTIDVYDSQHSYIGTFGGHSDDGDITVAWNLVGPDGVAHTNDSFFTFFVTTPFSDPPAPPTYKVTDPWSAPGAWVAAAQHAFDYIQDSDLLYSELDGFVGAARGNFTVLPTPANNGDPFAIRFQEDGEDSDWMTFRNALYDPTSRNLVYFGHGGPNGIGYNSHDVNQFVPATEIANVLHTIPAGQTNRHAFRFVFLDGCSTAKGTLPESFGIIHRENVPDIDYYNASLRPSAFVGWSADKYVGFFGNSLNYDHVHFIQWIQYDMLANGEGIKAAINYAAGQPDVTDVETSQFKVFGDWQLSFGAFNQ